MSSPPTAAASLRQPGHVAEKPWPALAALASAGILPATTARRTVHVTLGSAFLVHFLAALGTLIVGAVLVEYFDHLHREITFGDLWTKSTKYLGSVIIEFERDPLENTLILVGSILGIEALFILNALICIAWGAIDEPLRASFCNALQRVWLHTPHLLLVILLAGSASVYLLRAQARAREKLWDEVTAQQSSSEDSEEDQYEATKRRSTELWSESPFHVRYAEEITAIVWLAGSAWLFWGHLRFIGARRPSLPQARSPECEACGYNLTGIPLEGQCPECGERVALSLGPGVRPGAPWEHRRTLGRWRAWWQSLGAALWHGPWVANYAPACPARIIAGTWPLAFRSFSSSPGAG